MPDGVDPDVWAEFEGHRKDIRKPLTDRSRTKNANVLRKLGMEQQRECVDTTIAQHWTGLFPPKGNGKSKYDGPTETEKMLKGMIR